MSFVEVICSILYLEGPYCTIMCIGASVSYIMGSLQYCIYMCVYSIDHCLCHAVNNNSRVLSVKNMSADDIMKHLSLLRSSSGIKPTKLKKWWHTDNPSIQGNWTPFLNK